MLPRLGPVGERVLEGIILAMAGLVASAGVTFGCAVRNIVAEPAVFLAQLDVFEADRDAAVRNLPEVVGGESHGILMGQDLASLSFTIIPAVLMLIWLWAAFRFARARPRSATTWVMVLLMASAFVTFSVANWQMAYPVCNPV